MAKRGEYIQAEVLKVLRGRSEPMSAYDILSELRIADPKMAPTTVYRALSALTEKHSVHRLESMNAFMLCQSDHAHDEASILSICDDCGTVEENVAPDVVQNLSTVLGKSGFSAQHHVIEVHGTCETCGDSEQRS